MAISRVGNVADARRRLAGTATLRRSLRLLSAFRYEQSDPAFFYGAIASDTVEQVSRFTTLDRQHVLDVGGGPGYFRAAFTGSGAEYLAVDADWTELTTAGLLHPRTVIGSGTALPIATGTVDLCLSSNVLEHVAEPERMADEMVRVTRPGGVVYLSYMLWLGLHGGHETSPWHFLGGHRAARRYELRHGHPPKNRFGTSLFALSAGRMLTWLDQAVADDRVEVLAVFPRYHPSWAFWVTLVPGLREFTMWNQVFVLRRR